MKPFIWLLIIMVAFSSCRSVKKTTKESYQKKDSTTYVSVTSVDIDTVTVPSDTAVVEAVLTKDEFGKLYLESIKHDKGNDISISYSIEKTPEGKTKLRVQAVSDKKEILTQSKTTETVSNQTKTEEKAIIETKKVSGISMWHLAWIIPLILIAIVIYLKRKTIMKYLPF